VKKTLKINIIIKLNIKHYLEKFSLGNIIITAITIMILNKDI